MSRIRNCEAFLESLATVRSHKALEKLISNCSDEEFTALCEILHNTCRLIKHFHLENIHQSYYRLWCKSCSITSQQLYKREALCSSLKELKTVLYSIIPVALYLAKRHG